MLPTLIVVYLAKPYIEELLKQAAKDSYPILKRAILSLITKAFGVAPQSRQRQPSLLFSVYSITKTKASIKFVYEEGLTVAEYEKCVEEMFITLTGHFDAAGSDVLSEEIAHLGNKASKRVYLFYNETSDAWEVTDPTSRVLDSGGIQSQDAPRSST